MLNVPDTAPSGSSTGSLRNKVALKRGRGLMDWVRLGHSGQDLAGTSGKVLKITLEELAKHNTREDAWIALRGNVYNVTPYFEYHPGGEDELMKGAGIDATDLFNEVHKWVNFSTMLQKCLVGTLVESKPFFSKPDLLPLKKLGKSFEAKKNNSVDSSSRFCFPSFGPLKLKSEGRGPSKPSTLAPSQLPPPKYDWFQTKTLINIAIYTKWKKVRKSHVVLINNEEYFKAVVRIQDEVYTMHMELFKPVERQFELKIGNGCGKVDILMKKALPGVRWSSLGKTLRGNNQVVRALDKEIEFIPLSISEVQFVTHNSTLLTLEVPAHVHLGVPIGHHVYLRLPNSDLAKPYTPISAPFRVGHVDEEDESKDIQIYFKVYEDGALSPVMAALKEGDSLEVSFPEGTFSMENLQQAAVEASHLVLLAAGTGITPQIKLLLEALKNETKTLLVMFNRTENDIPWKVELDSLVITHSKLFRVSHVLSDPAASWSGYNGRIRRDLLEELIPSTESEPEQDLFFGVCGTTGFTSTTLSLLEEMNYSSERIFAFTG